MLIELDDFDVTTMVTDLDDNDLGSEAFFAGRLEVLMCKEEPSKFEMGVRFRQQQLAAGRDT